ncbi:MAG TPA: PepSY-like domain-containing protein [Panacibacter sp.]|nr:PepSY-like domain-containing protein [Panacibacter sp.]
MKRRFLLLLFVLVAAIAHAQIRKIPAEVTDAFAARYPHAEKVSWRDKVSYFEAQFMLNGFEMSAGFNSKGDWQRTERKIKFSDLPDDVEDGFLKSKYADWEKGSVVEIDEDSEPVIYRIVVKKNIQKKYLFFTTSGKLNREALTL